MISESEPTKNHVTIIAILLGATWGAFGAFMKAAEMINERGDLILAIRKQGVEHPLGLANPTLIFWCDWFPLAIGMLVFSIFFTIVMILLPHFMGNYVDPAFKRTLTLLCRVAAVLPAFSALSIIATGIAEFIVYRS